MQTAPAVFPLLVAGNTYTFSGFQSIEGGSEYLVFFVDASGDHLDIIFPTTSLVGYAGGLLCSTTAGQTCSNPTQFGNTGNGITFLAQGGTSSTNSVPEPSALLMLAGGLVGLGLLSRKMYFASGKAELQILVRHQMRTAGENFLAVFF